jgi:transportin-1
VPPILQHLILIISRPTHEVARALLENTAITIGRLGMAAPQTVAPLLEAFAAPLLLALRGIRDDVEKEHAFRGLVEIVSLNPAGVMGALPALYAAIGSWEELPPDLAPTLTSIATAYKAQVPAEAWPSFYASFPEHLRRRLTERHSI